MLNAESGLKLEAPNKVTEIHTSFVAQVTGNEQGRKRLENLIFNIRVYATVKILS